jgi:fibronectin type 3 domain-containing protein
MRAILKVALAALLVLLITGLVWFLVGSHRHRVNLSWHESPSTPSARIVGYNVYRSRTSGGPYAKLATRVPRSVYEDRLVNSRETYFYVVTSLDEAGRESGFSAEIRLTVP